MAVSDGQINVSDGAQRAIKNAIEGLRPYADEPRVGALARKLGAIAAPEDGFGERDDAVAKAMIDAEQLSKSEDAGPAVRERAAAASMELQRGYLARHSLGAAEWENAARAAGRVGD